MILQATKVKHVIKGDWLFLIVQDLYAGRRWRYTLHRINLAGAKSSRVIGREIPLKSCRALIASY